MAQGSATPGKSPTGKSPTGKSPTGKSPTGKSPTGEVKAALKIWVNEQFDPAGILSCCIACTNEEQAQACHKSFQENLTAAQKAEGWVAQLRTVDSWDEVPVAALKLG